MKTSADGIALIERREGKRLSAYRDSRGIWTIGVGHAATGLPPKPHAGMTITQAQCDALLAADLAPVEHVINTCVKVPLTQNEFDALASLGFNVGAGGLRGSMVVRKLNAGDVEAAAAAFMDWSRPIALAGRRAAERTQFLEPDPPGEVTVSPSHIVASGRAAALAARAGAAHIKAKSAATGGTVAAVAGATAAAAVAHHGHWAWVVGVVVLAGAGIDALACVLHAGSAATLTANAAAQTAVAARLAAVASPAAAPSVGPAALGVVSFDARPRKHDFNSLDLEFPMKIALLTALVFAAAWIAAWFAFIRPLLERYAATADVVGRIEAAEGDEWKRLAIWFEAKKTLLVAFLTSAFATGKAASDQAVSAVSALTPDAVTPLQDKTIWANFFNDVWTLHIVAALSLLTAFLTLKGKVQAARIVPKA